METRQTGNIDLLQGINKKYTNHQNIIQIKRKVNDKAPVFSFNYVPAKLTIKYGNQIPKKSCQGKEISLSNLEVMNLPEE